MFELGRRHETATVGDFWVPSDGISAHVLGDLSLDTHAPVEGLTRPPDGSAVRLSRVRVGLFKPWVASMDEGWTRFVLERYGFAPVSLTNKSLRDGDFTRMVDVLLFPDIEGSVIKDGRSSRATDKEPTLPPPYAGGIGAEGGKRIERWVKDGGLIVALDSSAEYLIELLDLPVTDELAKVKDDTFDCPGSMLRLEVDTAHPLAYGLRAEEAAYFAGSPAFSTRIPDARFDRRVVAAYPASADRILVSGYLKGADLLTRRAAVVDLRVGKGRVVLIGFRAQHRAQPHRTFKLLFNALQLAGREETRLP